MRAGQVESGARVGVWAEFADEGPGIADVQQAFAEGYSTGGGLGLGFGGARRLVHEFDVRTAPGEGTTVRVVTWR
jgi:serine/threonine-protein kinase RsbT